MGILQKFEQFEKDIFNNTDFLEEVIINGLYYKCIASSLDNTVSFSDYGLQNGANFTIDIKLPINPIPKINDKILFRTKTYKIDHIEVDSAGKSLKLFLIDLSKGIGR